MVMSVRKQEAAALDIEQEYNNALRIRSNARFFLSKKQRCEEEAILQTQQQQELIPPVLRNLMVHRRKTYLEIELAMAGYFDASAEASEMCVELLWNIESAQSNYRSMESFLASTSSGAGDAPLALNPFCTTRSNFKQIHHKYSSVFRSIRSSHKKVARKLKVLKAVKKLKVVKAVKKLQDQLDAAAKGTYVLSKDLDTVSQLVARLSDAIERDNAMAKCCMEAATSVEMVSELKRSYSISRRLAEELEEHVCLCVATIHRARVMVIGEISKSIN